MRFETICQISRSIGEISKELEPVDTRMLLVNLKPRQVLVRIEDWLIAGEEINQDGHSPKKEVLEVLYEEAYQHYRQLFKLVDKIEKIESSPYQDD